MKSSPTPNIKLIQSLQLLSKQEMQRFIDFAESKYFSGERKYRKSLECLQRLHETGFHGMSNAKLLTHLSNELGTSNRTLLNRLSELYLIFENFLIIEQLKNNVVEKDLLLLTSLFDRKGFRLFDYLSKKVKKSDGFLAMDLKTLENLNKIGHLESLAAFERGNYGEYQRLSSALSIFTTAHYLISLFRDSSEKIQQGIAGMSPGKLYSNIILENINLDKVFKLLKEEDNLLYNYVMIYYLIYKCFSDNSDTSYFQKVRKIHKQILNDITAEENESIYFAFTTYCINQVSIGRDEFYRTIFDIIKEKLNSGYDSELRKDNYPVNNFRDYVIIGLRVGEIEWVRDFISKYAPLLPDSYKVDETNISFGRIAQYEGDYERALKHLEKIKKKNYLHYLDTLTLRIRSYCELDRTDEAYLEIERLKQYVNYHKEIPEVLMKDHTYFINDVLALLRYSEKQLTSADLMYKLCNRKSHKPRPWITEKLNRILENRK
jgi:hypothetical protein